MVGRESNSAVDRTLQSLSLRCTLQSVVKFRSVNDPAEADSGDISDRFRSGKDTGESDSAVGRTPRSQIPQWEGHQGVRFRSGNDTAE